jgi:hypothetical protein
MLVVLLAPVVGWADSVTYSSNVITNATTNWTNTLTVPKWDPVGAYAGDTLTQVVVSYTGDVFGNMQFENIDPGHTALLVSSKLSAVENLYDVNSVPIITQTPSVTKGPASLSTYTGDFPYQYQPPDGVSYNSVTNTLTTVWYNGTSSYLAMFTGTGNINLQTDATGHDTSTTSGGDVVSKWLNQAGVSMTVEYDYSSMVPEPCTLPLMALGLASIGMLRKRRRA